MSLVSDAALPIPDWPIRHTSLSTWRGRSTPRSGPSNCAGSMPCSIARASCRTLPGNSTVGAHLQGPSALFHACERAGVRRVVHLSAVGIDRATPTEFSQTKLAGDQALIARDLDWVILRPSVVVGRAAYGGSALIRELAALPILPVMPTTAPLQIVHLDDLVDAIAFFLQPAAPSKCVVEVVGPKRHSFEEVIRIFRRWMRWPPATEVPSTWMDRGIDLPARGRRRTPGLAASCWNNGRT